MTALGGLIAGSVVAVALAGFKAIERAWSKKDEDARKDERFNAHDRERLNNVATIVSRCDAEGVPMAYVPRRLIKLAEGQQDLMRQMAALAERQTALTEGLHESLGSHMNREETELERIRKAVEAGS